MFSIFLLAMLMAGFIDVQRNIDPALGGTRFRKVHILIEEKSVESVKKLDLQLSENHVLSELNLIHEDDYNYYVIPSRNSKNKLSIIIPKRITNGAYFIK
jgi:hypothetical protein